MHTPGGILRFNHANQATAILTMIFFLNQAMVTMIKIINDSGQSDVSNFRFGLVFIKQK
jgi:hypothetical protein